MAPVCAMELCDQGLLSHNSYSGHPRRVVRRGRRKCAPFSARAAIGDATEGPNNAGNPALQESLVSMVRLQIGQEKVKESVEVERQKLQELADEAKEEVDRLSQLTKDRSTLAFGSAIV